MDSTGTNRDSGTGEATRCLANCLRRLRVPSKDVYLSTLTNSDLGGIWPITSENANLFLFEQSYGTDARHFERFDRILAKEIGDLQKVHFTFKGIQDDRLRDWGYIGLTEITCPLRCTLFFPDDAAEMTIQVVHLILQSAFDCDGYTELELHMSKLNVDPGVEHGKFGFGLVNVIRNQHLDRKRSTMNDVYVITAQQWRILRECIAPWLSSLGTLGIQDV